MRNSTEKQKGFVLVVVAGILIALIGFVALGVDTGALYSARTSAQEAADAGALAAALTFVTNPETQPATAIAHGKAAAMANTIMGQVDSGHGCYSHGGCPFRRWPILSRGGGCHQDSANIFR